MEEIIFSQLCNKGGLSITVACSGGHASCIDSRGNDNHGLWLVGNLHKEREREKLVGQRQNRKKEVLR